MRFPILSTFLLLAACESAATSEKTGMPASNKPPTEIPFAVDAVDNAAALPAENSKTIGADWLLVPGKSAGKTEVGQTLEETTARLGKPDAGDAAMMHYVSVWYADKKAKTGHSVAVFSVRDAGNNPEARIKQIRVNAPQFRTATGIGVGSSLAAIKAHFFLTPTNRYTEINKAYTLFDSNAGIGFEVNDKDACTSVIIHAANERFEGTYLNFR